MSIEARPARTGAIGLGAFRLSLTLAQTVSVRGLEVIRTWFSGAVWQKAAKQAAYLWVLDFTL